MPTQYFRNMGVPSLKTYSPIAVGKQVGDVFSKLGTYSDEVATQNMLDQLSQYTQEDSSRTERDALDYLQSLGVRNNVASKGQAYLKNMFTPTNAEADKAADAAKQKEAYQKYTIDGALEALKHKHAKTIADDRNKTLLDVAKIRSKSNKENKGKASFPNDWIIDTDYFSVNEAETPSEASIMFRSIFADDVNSKDEMQQLMDDYQVWIRKDQWGTPTVNPSSIEDFKKDIKKLTNKN